MRELHNWSFAKRGHHDVLEGDLHNDPRYPDGHQVVTAAVKHAVPRDGYIVVKTYSKSYRLVGRSDAQISNAVLAKYIIKTANRVAAGLDLRKPPGFGKETMQDAAREDTGGKDASKDADDDQTLLEGINDPY
mgnify:CR=1 FL=1